MMRPLNWQNETRLPRCVAALLNALRLDAAPVEWPRAEDREWDRAVYFLHRNQLTLLVRHAAAGRLPAYLRSKLDADYAANRRRLERLKESTSEVLMLLHDAGISAVLLKGFARVSEYVPDPTARM